MHNLFFNNFYMQQKSDFIETIITYNPNDIYTYNYNSINIEWINLWPNQRRVIVSREVWKIITEWKIHEAISKMKNLYHWQPN